MTSSTHATELDKIADRMEKDGISADTLRLLAADLRAQKFESLRAVAGDQVHVLAASKGRALTLVEVVNAAKDDSLQMTRLANLRIRCSSLGLDIPADAPLTVRMVDDAFSKVNSSISQRMSAKADLMRAGLLTASGV
jgi:hypothetical protein